MKIIITLDVDDDESFVDVSDSTGLDEPTFLIVHAALSPYGDVEIQREDA